jgi:nucleoside 2-deoxyribosyltransferase
MDRSLDPVERRSLGPLELADVAIVCITDSESSIDTATAIGFMCNEYHSS